MISAHRVGKARYAAEPLSGIGGTYVGGRWHHKGVRIVYAAQTLSLASLEFFVHFGRLESAISLVWFEFAIPDELVQEVDGSALPAGWDSDPPVAATADIGMNWLRSGSSVVLKVPSAVTQGEYNLLINPSHADIGKIHVVKTASFSYDSRMWK